MSIKHLPFIQFHTHRGNTPTNLRDGQWSYTHILEVLCSDWSNFNFPVKPDYFNVSWIEEEHTTMTKTLLKKSSNGCTSFADTSTKVSTSMAAGECKTQIRAESSSAFFLISNYRQLKLDYRISIRWWGTRAQKSYKCIRINSDFSMVSRSIPGFISFFTDKKVSHKALSSLVSNAASST